MESTPFSLTFDRTGFPLVRHRNWNFSISLFPVSKYQFERFLATVQPEGELFTDAWYRQLLAANPRCGWHEVEGRPWQLFLSGMDLAVMNRFFQYIGPGCRLPLAEEWRQLHQCASEMTSAADLLLAECREAPLPVAHWLRAGLFPLTDEGMLEYVEVEGGVKSIGKPFYDYHPTLWRPDSLRDIEPESPFSALAGFRLVVA